MNDAKTYTIYQHYGNDGFAYLKLEFGRNVRGKKLKLRIGMYMLDSSMIQKELCNRKKIPGGIRKKETVNDRTM